MTLSNVDKLNIEISILTESAIASMSRLSTETADYGRLVEQVGIKTQALMDATGMSYSAAVAKIKEVNKTLVENNLALQGAPGRVATVDPTLLSGALRDAENIRKSTLGVMGQEIAAENKLYDSALKRSMLDEAATNALVEKVVQKRAEAQVDASDLAFEKLKTLELEKQLQLQTGMNAQQRAITAGRIPLANVDMRKAVMENVAFDVSKFVGVNGLNPQLNNVLTTMNKIKAANPSVTFDEIGNSMSKAGVNAGTVAQGVAKLEPAAKRASQGFSILRAAMGFLTAMAMSAIMQGVIKVFKKIIDSASQAEQAFIKLAIAEKAISQAGVDITPKELVDIIDKVSEAYISVSKIDAQKMVSSLAVLTKDLKLSAADYEKLAMAIPLVAMQAGVSIDSATNQVITGLTKSGRGWADLGITVDAEIIRQKAVSSGIVKTREAYDALTAEQKQQVEVLALLQILEDNTVINKEKMGEYNNSLAGSQASLNASWEDYAAVLGAIAKPALITFYQNLATWLTNLTTDLEENKGKWIAWGEQSLDTLKDINDAFVTVGLAFDTLQGKIDGGGKKTGKRGFFADLRDSILSVLAAFSTVYAMVAGGLLTFFIELPSQGIIQAAKDAGNSISTAFVVGMSTSLALALKSSNGKGAGWIKSWWKDQFGVDLDAIAAPPVIPPTTQEFPDTPTAPQDPNDPANLEIEADKKRQEALDKYSQELIETEIKAAQEREDIAIDLGRQLVDIEIEYDRKRADAAKDYQDKIRDINQSYEEEIASLKQKSAEDAEKHRNDDLKREQDYQNKLLEMRENYLMSLEDALHSRDARQVLKLMRQYELDKLQAARQHDLDMSQADQDEKQRRKDIELEIKRAKDKRAIKLAEAKQDYEDKLAQMKIDEKREIEDAKLKARRKLEDLAKANQDKMALLAAQLIQEYQLTGQWKDKMIGLYLQYYKDLARIYDYINKLKAAAAGGQMPAPSPSGTGDPRNVPHTPRRTPRRAPPPPAPTPSGSGDPGFSMFSNFGGSAMPRNRIGSGATNSGIGGGQGMGSGKMTIELLLSPDLESRIVANSLDATANIITRISRGK